MTPELITSAQNHKLKRLLALQEKSRLRREEGVFVVEGRREFEHCIAAGFEIDSIFICPEICDAAWLGIPPEGRNTRGSIAGGPSRRDGGVSPKDELPKGDYPAQRGFPGRQTPLRFRIRRRGNAPTPDALRLRKPLLNGADGTSPEGQGGASA